jgi:hypothetical protein
MCRLTKQTIKPELYIRAAHPSACNASPASPRLQPSGFAAAAAAAAARPESDKPDDFDATDAAVTAAGTLHVVLPVTVL